MKRLTPVTCHVPSGCWTAFARPAPTSEPASGSVRTIVEPHRLSTMCPARTFCSSVPRRYMVWAKAKPEEYMCTAGLDPRTSSATAQRSDGGTTVPPSSAGTSIRHHSASR